MKNEIVPVYLFVYLVGVFLAAVSQVLLKKAAQRPHKNLIEEYTDWRVILGYGIFVGCTLLKLGVKKVAALALIIGGILVYSLFG